MIGLPKSLLWYCQLLAKSHGDLYHETWEEHRWDLLSPPPPCALALIVFSLCSLMISLYIRSAFLCSLSSLALVPKRRESSKLKEGNKSLRSKPPNISKDSITTDMNSSVSFFFSSQNPLDRSRRCDKLSLWSGFSQSDWYKLQHQRRSTLQSRYAEIASWVLNTSSANSGDKTTTVGTCQRLIDIKGPCILAKSLRPWCGKEPPSWWIFPMIGNFHGPGGCFEELLCDLFNIFRAINTNRNKLIRNIGNMGNWKSIIERER